MKLELEIDENDYEIIKALAVIKEKEPRALITDELIKVFHVYREDCKHLLG